MIVRPVSMNGVIILPSKISGCFQIPNCKFDERETRNCQAWKSDLQPCNLNSQSTRPVRLLGNPIRISEEFISA